MRPIWSRIVFTLAAMGARCCTAARDEHPAERPWCLFHGMQHECWRERRVGRAF